MSVRTEQARDECKEFYVKHHVVYLREELPGQGSDRETDYEQEQQRD